MGRAKQEKQKLARIVRQRYGYEMMPDECDSTLSSALTAIRDGMAAKGYKLPDDDDQLRLLIRKAYPELLRKYGVKK